MLFYLGHSSYYSDEIRWSRRFTDAVLLGTPVILLWWNQVVQEVCRCCFTWDTVILLWWNQVVQEVKQHATNLLGPPDIHSEWIWQVVQEVKQHATNLLDHLSYSLRVNIRWSRRLTACCFTWDTVILLWWNQVVQEVCRCCFTWDTRHITLMKSGGPGGLQMLFYLGHSSYYSDETSWMPPDLGHQSTLMIRWSQVQMLFYLGHPSYYSDEILRRFVDADLHGTPVIYDEIRWSRRLKHASTWETSYYLISSE